jgi:hypothetical protein
MPVGDQDHGGVPVTMAIVLRGLYHPLDLGRGQVLAPPKHGVLRPAGATARFSMAGVTSRSFDFTGILASH